MPSLAATATSPTTSLAIGALTLIIITLGYLLACWLYPFVTCHHCSGTGKRRPIFGRRSFALCRHCHGDGQHLRPGRHLLNYLRNTHDKATKQ